MRIRRGSPARSRSPSRRASQPGPGSPTADRPPTRSSSRSPGRCTTARPGEARSLTGASVAEAAHVLGNGAQSTAQDSVPLAVWAAARHLNDYPAAVVTCIEAGGDVDTTAAMAGGIVAARTGVATSGAGIVGVPRDWLAAREHLPDWAGRRAGR
jgi:ADP-ribosylglycohydrolase